MISSVAFRISKKDLLSSYQKTTLLQHKRTGFFDFLGRGKSDQDEKKEMLNKNATKQETKELAESLVKGEEQSAVDSKTEVKVLDMKNIRVVGDADAYNEHLDNLKEHRISSLKLNNWIIKEPLKTKEFEKFESILRDLLLKHNLELNDLAVPFKDFKTKFLFSKEIQAKTGVVLSDYNITLFSSPKDYKKFFYEVVLSGELFKYQEKKPLAITIDVVADASSQTDKELALQRLEAEFSNESEPVTMKHRDLNPQYQGLLNSMVDRTKILRPEVNNVRVKTFRNFKDQNVLKQKIKDEIEYSNIKKEGLQTLSEI